MDLGLGVDVNRVAAVHVVVNFQFMVRMHIVTSFLTSGGPVFPHV